MSLSLEERFALLEKEVARIRAEVGQKSGWETRQSSGDFLDSVIGIHANSPAFEEVAAQIEAERESERAKARRLAAQDARQG